MITCKRGLRWVLWLLMVALITLPAPGRAEESPGESPEESGEEAVVEVDAYMENQYNFVEASMDISGGIPDDAQGVLADIRDEGVLRVATEPYFPPQEFIDPDLQGQETYVGSDMRLARRIAERMGVRLEIVPKDFSAVLDEVAENRCHLAISGLSYTPGRAAKMTLSKGYYFAGSNAGSGLIIRAADSGRIRGVDDLADRNIGAQSGSLQEAQMSENVFHYRQFRRFAQVLDVYQALMEGSIDAGAVDYTTGTEYIESNPKCGLMMVPGVHFTLAEQFDGDRVAARKGEGQLIGFVNAVIDEVLASGEYNTWYEEASVRAGQLGL